MKKLIIAFLAILLATPAFADGGRGGGYGGGWGHGGGGHGGGWGRGGGWGGDWIIPSLIGGAILYDMAQPQTAYVQQLAPVYAPTTVAPQAVQFWYFCSAANAYYPYVSACPSGWQAVPATPPAALPSAPSYAPPSAAPPSARPESMRIVPDNDQG